MAPYFCLGADPVPGRCGPPDGGSLPGPAETAGYGPPQFGKCPAGSSPVCRQLLALQKADRAGKGVGEDLDTEPAEQLLDKILAQNSCFSLRDLAVNGNDLLEAGFLPGPQIGKTLNTLLAMVVDQQLPNDKDALLEAALAQKEDTP